MNNSTKFRILYIRYMDCKADECLGCKTSFSEVKYHAKDFCQKCYYNSRKKTKIKLDYCITCLCKFGSQSEKNKTVKPGPKSMCRSCYHRSYIKSINSGCKRCGKDLGGRKVKGLCSLCKVELDAMKAPSKRTLPNVNKINIDKDTKESMRKLFNRYKFGLNTLADPFVVIDIYLTVFSSEATKGQTASKTEFNLDQFEQEDQVIAMLKLLKMAYDKA